MGFRLVHFCCFIFAVPVGTSWALPFEDGQFPSPQHAGFIAELRRSSSQPPGVHVAGVLPIFDPTFATDQLKSVLNKYAQAAQFLAGIGLNPDTHPESGYEPYVAPVKASINNTDADPDSSEITDTSSLFGNRTEAADGIISVPGVAQMPLSDYVAGSLDVSYYGPLKFGAGGQPLAVDIDTGSADLWIPVNCRTCSNAQFRAAQSPSYASLGRRFSVTYGTGRVSGTLAQDTVALGGLSVPRQAFGAVTKESDDFDDAPSSGLLGLAFGSIAASRQPTFFENLMSTKQLAAGVFAVHLTRGKETGSEACFGCVDTTKTVGPINWNPVVSRTYWSIQMDGISPDATNTVPTNLTAAIDTGTSLIYVPDDVAKEFYGLIPGAQPAMQYGGGFYTFPCTGAPTVSLSFGGQAYSVDAGDFNLGRTATDSPDCVGGILALGDGFPPDLAIIGDEFLKSWYSVYDYAGSRVGFAPSINNERSVPT
ncbi:aspartic peptidase domain-containing protein [Amylocystis lapponica]|nr:aspartic peptidase domain-containing protein [Amylocystis lapponica]